MNNKTCEECRAGFDSSRNTQRFCSTRCANRQRDRRRRQKKQLLAGRSTDSPVISLRNHKTEDSSHGPAEPDTRRRHRGDASTTRCRRAIDHLQIRLRSQSLDLEHAEAVNAEQQARISSLQGELAHLKRAQRINIKDLAHVAARLVAVTKAKGLSLDPVTVEILRRRGWISQKRKAEAPRP